MQYSLRQIRLPSSLALLHLSLVRHTLLRLALVLICAVTMLACSTPASVGKSQNSLQDTADQSLLEEEESDWRTHSHTKPIPLVLSPAVSPRLYSLDAVDLPLNALLYSLASEAGLELQLDDEHTDLITLGISDKPIDYILDQLARRAPIRWELLSGRLEISLDEPFLKSYPVDYLNISRHTQSSVGLATQVGSINLNAEASGGGSGFSNNSQSLIENDSRHEFWESLTRDLDVILAADASSPDHVLVNRDVGLVSVRATSRRHREVERYLNKVNHISSRQVLIEATVVEVTLSNRFQAGIDWRALDPDGGSGVNVAQIFHGRPQVQESTINTLVTPATLLTAIHKSNSIGQITATLDLLQEFGDVKILSRPQIIAINNQSAVLKVVDNRVYFTMSVDRQSRDGVDDVTTTTEIHTVPVGLVMSVTPFIGADASVTLNVRPTISRILGFVNDPNPELAAASVKNGVPEIQVREMESVLKVANGQIVMIGGLMQHQRSTEESEVPWLARVPGVGRLFQNHRRLSKKTELLVFLQPTVMETAVDNNEGT